MATTESFKIFVAGDTGEDVYSWVDEGSRSARPASVNLPADKARDAVVPSGAGFIKAVFDNFFEKDSVQDCLNNNKPPGKAISLGSVDQILTHFRTFKKADGKDVDRIDRFIILTTVDESETEQSQKRWLPLNGPYPGPNKLLILHHGAAAAKADATADEIKSWLGQFVDTNRGRLQILVNIKQLPEISSWDLDDPTFESSFWNAIFDMDIRQYVGIVVSLSALRRAGAKISFGLSWEQTADDFGFELHCFPKLKALSYFRDVFVRVETIGLIHLKNPDSGANAQLNADLYYERYEKSRDPRDPERDGRIVGKNSLLLAALAHQVRKSRQAAGKIDEAAISEGIVSGIRAGIATYRQGYDRDSFLKKTKSHRFIKWSEAAQSVICKGEADKLPKIVKLPIPSDRLSHPLQRNGRWHILDKLLADGVDQIAPINVALAVVMEGPHNVLNQEWEIYQKPNSTPDPAESPTRKRILTLLNRPDCLGKERTPNKSFALAVPIVQFGKLLAVGRDESDEICGIYNLLSLYIRERRHYDKPVSIAVFGPPGSGKSFAVKEIANTIDPVHDQIEIMEYNLAQFSNSGELGNVLNRVGSINNSGKTPLVFFDEFDCTFNETLGWLKFFLAPMQDGNFYGAAGTINIGRAIFVFAGGRGKTFHEFTSLPDFDNRKGPDFISRLRGHINIRPIDAEPEQKPPYMRRAITLRGLLEKHHFVRKVEDKGDRAMVDEALIYALLDIGAGFKHGVRSMEAVLQMCATIDGVVQVGSLPSREQLRMHVDPDEFYEKFLRGRTRQSPSSPLLGEMLGTLEKRRDDLAKQKKRVDDIMREIRELVCDPREDASGAECLESLKQKAGVLEALVADARVAQGNA
jgi:hypothetical protein